MQNITPNKRLKDAINKLDDTVERISASIGIPKRTLYGLFEDGATIKGDYLIALNERYGIDPNQILLGSATFSTDPKESINYDKVYKAAGMDFESQQLFMVDISKILSMNLSSDQKVEMIKLYLKLKGNV